MPADARIRLEREPKGWGSWPSERCCFCRAPTRFWVLNAAGKVDGASVACCESCAEARASSELPTKKAWIAAERARDRKAAPDAR